MIYNLFLLLMDGGCILSIFPCQPLHAVGYPFDCPNTVCLIAFPSINQTPKQNYPSQLEKISRYPKENEPEIFLNTYPYQRKADFDLLTPDPYPKKILNVHIQTSSENFWNLVSDIHPYPNVTLVKYVTGSGERSTTGPSFLKTYSSIAWTMTLIHDKCAVDCTTLRGNLVNLSLTLTPNP